MSDEETALGRVAAQAAANAAVREPAPPAVEVPVPTTPEPSPTPPAAKKEMTRAGFGLLSTEEFDPETYFIKGKDGKPTSEKLKTRFENNLTILASQLEQYQRSPGAQLTQEQRDFLVLYKKLGSKILNTEAGWALGNLVLEQDMMLRLAAIGKNLERDMTQRLTRPLFGGKKDGDLRLTVRDVQGLITKYGLEFVKKGLPGGLAYWPYEGIRALFKKDAAGLRLKDFTIDISQLPEAYRKYMEYLSPTIDKPGSQRFLLRIGEGRINFYEALGVPPNKLEAVTPFERFLYAGADADKTQENLATEWMRIRRQSLERKVRERGLDVSNLSIDRATELFFDAQQETIRHFLNLFTPEIIKARLGVEKITIKAGEGEETQILELEAPRSITSLQEKRNKLASPEGAVEVKSKKQQELDDLKRNLAVWEQEIKDKQATISQKRLEQITLEKRKPRLTQKESQYETTLTDILIPLRNRAKENVDQLAEEYNRLFKQQNPDQDELKRIEKLKNGQSTELTRIQQQVTELNDKLNQARDELNRIDEIGAEIELLEQEVGALGKKIGKTEKSGARKRIIALEAELTTGLEQSTQEKVDQLDTVISCLRNYDQIVSTPISSPEESRTNIAELVSPTVETEVDGKIYSKGYLIILDLLFHYTTAPDRKKAFGTALNILPEAELANLLNNTLRLRIVNPDLNSVLSQIEVTYKVGRLSQTDISRSFLVCLQFIEDHGKKI